ncbi:DUF930 domain-containing protein [Ancylobacter oerskovii]|uniref:DUF930 domain-containing protein n=1 Tax=Ancylobacter oerskovii TaxID=459519 RepID=A0ABW4Z3S2_9HYPH|nr:DUF930 domain-containing protein [Ancylobacter oerskovii]
MIAAPCVELGALDAPVPPAAPSRRGIGAAWLAGALLLHLAVLAPAVRIGTAPPPAPGEGPAVETEIISARDFDGLRSGAPPPAVAQPADPAPSVPEAAADATPSASPAVHPPATAARPDDMIRPARMLSARLLADPRGRATRRALATLADEERVAQLCDLEAMEQIHAWQPAYQPDRLVDYARADTRQHGNSLVAGGGAFRSGRKWYEVSFSCDLDAGLREVVGFAFKVGEAIPRQEWTALNLPAVH